MFNTLVESKAKRSRSTKGTLTSVLLHGVAIAIAVTMTTATKGDAKPQPPEKPIIFVPTPQPPSIRTPTESGQPHPIPAPTKQWIIVAPKDMPKELPPIDISGPPIPPDAIPQLVGGGLPSPYPGPKTSFGPNTVVSSDAVERIPRILGDARPPRYPDALRASNIAGSVAVRFVVDTLGRAEMDGLQVVETSHPLFAEAVKNALAFYRFSPGEVGGRKVRTMVQIPFTFSLTK